MSMTPSTGPIHTSASSADHDRWRLRVRRAVGQLLFVALLVGCTPERSPMCPTVVAAPAPVSTSECTAPPVSVPAPSGESQPSTAEPVADAAGMPFAELSIAPDDVDQHGYEVDESAVAQTLVLAIAGQLPVARAESGSGYVVKSAPVGSILAQAGLRPGDVVTALNGVDVDDPESLKTAYRVLHRNGTLVLTVQRAGELQTLRYRLRRSAASGPGAVVTPIPLPPQTNPPWRELLARGIKQVKPQVYQVDRVILDEALQNPRWSFERARLLPAIRGGKTVGMRVWGIRRGTLLERLGFKNGDTVESINGMPLTSPEQALEIYAKLRLAKRIKVRILRRGKPMTFEYRIR